jgi:hypothetical protein
VRVDSRCAVDSCSHLYCGVKVSFLADKRGQETVGRNRAGEERAEQNRTGQEMAGRNRAGEERRGQESTE